MGRTREERLVNPEPGSAAARARDFGIDLTLLLQNLKLTPEERLEQLQQAMIDLEELRGAAARKIDRAISDTDFEQSRPGKK